MFGSKPWLVAYDIRSAKRLQRVHRFMVGWGRPLQYSVFAVDASDEECLHMIAGLERRIDPTVDDVRVYRLPNRGGAWAGRGPDRDGFLLTGSETEHTLAQLKRLDGPLFDQKGTSG